MHSRRIQRMLLLASALWLAAAGAASSEPAAEYEVKAAFLLNFVRLVEWPESAFVDADEPLRIGVLVDDPFRGVLAALLHGQQVHGRNLRASRVASVREARDTHLIFVPATQSKKLAELRRELEESHVLLVGESERFAARGGVINLYKEEGRIRFEINRRAASQAGLKLSSRLLRLARLVDSEEE